MSDTQNSNPAAPSGAPSGEAPEPSRQQVRRVIIIGSGPAGLTAALYTARANLRPLVFEGDGFLGTIPGGQLMITTDVENYPGMVTWPDGKLHGMAGPDMMEVLRRQAQHFGAECVPKRITAVDFSRRPFLVQSDDERFLAETVIIATGASARWLGIPSEAEYINYGVSACATCDGSLFKDKNVLVVGGGDTAMEDALYLTRHCATVTIVHRRDALRASKIMAARAKANPKIRFMWNSVIIEFLGRTEGFRKFVTSVRIKDTLTGDVRTETTEGVFMAFGHDPNTAIFKGHAAMDEGGYVLMNNRSSYTNIPGVFACGDCQDRVYRQAVTAAGTGCMAAIDAERFLEANPMTSKQ